MNELLPSGAEVMLREALPHWNTLQSHILSTAFDAGPYRSALQDSGFVVHHIPFAKNVTFFKRLWRLLSAEQFDVVHIHTERANAIYSILARLSGAVVVRTIHAMFRFPRRVRFQRTVERALLRRLGAVQVSIGSAVSEWEAAQFGNPTITINNWVADRFRPLPPTERRTLRVALGLSGDRKIIVTVGNCSPNKNHEQVLYAVRQLSETTRVQYVHIGIEDDARSELALARQLGLGEAVRFEGFVADVAPYLQAADVFVMPSLVEGMGVAALEALACGLPAVMSDIPGLRQLQAMTKNSLWVEPSGDALSRAIHALLSRSDEENYVAGMNSSLAVHGAFGVERGAAAYVNLYRKTLVRMGKGRPGLPSRRT